MKGAPGCWWQKFLSSMARKGTSERWERTGGVLQELCSHRQCIVHWKIEPVPGSFILLPSSVFIPCAKKKLGRSYFLFPSIRRANILLSQLYPIKSAVSFFYIPKWMARSSVVIKLLCYCERFTIFLLILFWLSKSKLWNGIKDERLAEIYIYVCVCI